MEAGSPPTAARKEALRRQLRAQLRALPPGAAARAGRELAAHLVASKIWRSARRLALFVGGRGEPDTGPLLRAAAAAGQRVWVPRVVGACPPEMEFVPLEDPAALAPGAFGILEPTAQAPGLPLAELAPDMVAVPGLAFGRDGSRLGHGRGYYDRALTGLDPGVPRVGLALDAFVLEALPMAPHDQRVGWVASEAGLWRCTPPG